MTHLETYVPCKVPAIDKTKQTAVYNEPTVHEETDTKTAKPTNASAHEVFANSELKIKGTYMRHLLLNVLYIRTQAINIASLFVPEGERCLL